MTDAEQFLANLETAAKVAEKNWGKKYSEESDEAINQLEATMNFIDIAPTPPPSSGWWAWCGGWRIQTIIHLTASKTLIAPRKNAMIDCLELRPRILAAISSVPCDRCRQRPDYKPSDCETHTCRQMYEQEADAVMMVLPQSQGLSVKEQACFLWALCRYSNNPESCPLNLMCDLSECPFDEDCDSVEPMDWLPILENRIIPETNR